MRFGGFVLAALAVGVVSLPISSPVHAAAALGQQQVLSESDQQSFAGDAERQRCAEGTEVTDLRMAGRALYQDGWAFELSGTGLVSLAVTFAPGGDVSEPADRVVITGDAGDPASPITFHPSQPGHHDAYLFTPAGWLLVTATAEFERGQELSLSHTCAGVPEESVTPAPDISGAPSGAYAAPSGDPTTPDPGASASPAGLPLTGAQVGGLVLLGGGMLAGGIAMLAVRRRGNLSRLVDEP